MERFSHSKPGSPGDSRLRFSENLRSGDTPSGDSSKPAATAVDSDTPSRLKINFPSSPATSDSPGHSRLRFSENLRSGDTPSGDSSKPADTTVDSGIPSRLKISQNLQESARVTPKPALSAAAALDSRLRLSPNLEAAESKLKISQNIEFIQSILSNLSEEELNSGKLYNIFNGTLYKSPDGEYKYDDAFKVVLFGNLKQIVGRRFSFARLWGIGHSGAEIYSEGLKGESQLAGDRTKFYLSLNAETEKNSSDSTRFLEELAQECRSKRIQLEMKVQDHRYDNPCIYTDEPDRLEIVLRELYSKHPKNIWTDRPRIFQKEVNGVSSKHIASVQEPYSFFNLDSHSGRMNTLAKFINKEILKGRVLDERLYTQACIYAGVSPENPHTINPNLINNSLPLPEAYNVAVQNVKKKNQLKEHISKFDNYRSLPKSELKVLVTELERRLNELYSEGYRGFGPVYDGEELLNEVKRFLNSTSPESITSII